jgi:hypothetical protein
MGFETPAMAPAHEEHNKSPKHLTIPSNQSLLTEKETSDSTKAKSSCVEVVFQETHEVEKNSKVFGQQKENVSETYKEDTTKYTAVYAYTQVPQVFAEAKPTEEGEGIGEDQVDSINTDAVLVSTRALGPFDCGTLELSQVRDPAQSESPIQNKDDTEED